MPIFNKDKFQIKSLFKLEGYNAKQLVREYRQVRNIGNAYKLLQKLRVTGSAISAAADDEAPALLITFVLFMNWCYTKMARQEIISAHCT